MNRTSCIVFTLAAVLLGSMRLTIAGEAIGTSEQPLETGKPTSKPAKGTCITGFVWREARPSDHVCVRPKTRDDVASQNKTRAKRWTQGPYGPQTCVQGYVWREAFDGDKVCVTPEFREQTKEDNRAAVRRVAK
jgi:hypothetical protein